MPKHMRRLGPTAWVACGILVWSIAMVSARATAPGAEPVVPAVAKTPAAVGNIPQDEPAAQADRTYLDDEEICIFCHEDYEAGYLNSAHHFAQDPRTPMAANSCETCHGPGQEHVDADEPETVFMFNPATAPVDEVNALCLDCHDRGEHVLWQGSQHEARGLSCVSCHSQHEDNADTMLLKGADQIDTCGTCHRDKVSKLDRSGHMPVREGKMECTTCHNAHGSTNVRLLRIGDSLSEVCTSCHADKRGPFLWEHGPARDGCATCHDPHGSSNERMLVARPPILCQRCHVFSQHPSTIYDNAQVSSSLRVYARSCVTCHSAIHGSNHPNGERFIR
jgi:DmsE family decaheme c-type cytochrome